jgi:hypothetical protein
MSAALQNDCVQQRVLTRIHRFVKAMQKGDPLGFRAARPGWKSALRRSDRRARIFNVPEPDTVEHFPGRRIM